MNETVIFGLERSQHRRAALLAFGLLLFGFVAGYGYGFGVYRTDVKDVSLASPPTAVAPVVKGMKVSPDGRLLAFTGVYDQSRRASTFVFDLKQNTWSSQESPVGWQDYVTQWSGDGRDLLLERERIPRPVAEAEAGFYRRKVHRADPQPSIDAAMQPLSDGAAPRGEKIIGGLWDARGNLIIRTRREPKSLLQIENNRARLLDRTTGSFLQSRSIVENGRTVFYVVRPQSDKDGAPMALFRIDGGKAKQLGAPLGDAEWVYLGEDAHHMIVARYAPNGVDWRWSFYSITAQSTLKQSEATIPGDVISVYWSPDYRTILGASGQSLWLIDVPKLQARRLTDRHNWNADDAAWTADSRSVLVAADGKLHRIDVRSGQIQVLWTFPARFWV